jgi:hypothetical protein
VKERHWINLVSTLRFGQCILVLGPEVPADTPADPSATLTTYSDALRTKLAKELQDDNKEVTATSLAGVAQHYEDADGFGPGTLRSQAASFYATTPLEPSEVHRALAALPFPLILTTCHDRLLHDALVSAGKQPVPYRYHLRGDRSDNPEFVGSPSADTPILYHLFGTFDEPQSLVLSENDLLDFLISVVSERPPLPNSLRRALQRQGVSLLFVGFGIRHWYLRVLLKALVRSVLLGRSSSAVALEPFLHAVPDFDRQQTVLFYQRGTRVEVYDGDVLEFLAELRRRVDALGGIPVAAPPIGVRPRVFVSYAHQDNALAARLFGSLQHHGFAPWLDQDALRGGERWNDVIEDQLRDAEYVLVLETRSLIAKRVGYINKEIAVARDQAQHYRGSFLIPLQTEGVTSEDALEELRAYQRMPLRESQYDADIAALVSVMRRDYQRRQRQLT